MDNRKLFFPLLLCILLSACVKDDADYGQYYRVHYYKVEDSFVADAMLAGEMPHVKLNKHESVTFNGEAPHKTSGDYFIWTGKGRPDARFVFKQRKREHVTTLSAGTLGECDFTFPDTVSLSQGFVIKVQNYRRENNCSLILNSDDPTGNTLNISIVGDSAVVPPSFSSPLPLGVVSISLNELIYTLVGNWPDPNQGVVDYSMEYKKKIVLVP